MSAGSAAYSESKRARDKAEELRRRAERLDARASNFEAGGEGELLVSSELQKLLPVGFAVIDDIRWPGSARAYIDHLVYGPAGMFAVDAKNWTGNVTVKDGILRQNGYRRTTTVDKAQSMALSVQSRVGPSAGVIRPVVCLAGHPGQAAAWCGPTLVVGLNGLAAWLFRQPSIWPATHVDALSAWLPQILQTADPRSESPVAVARPTERSAPSSQLAQQPQARSRGLYGWLRSSR